MGEIKEEMMTDKELIGDLLQVVEDEFESILRILKNEIEETILILPAKIMRRLIKDLKK